jgi:lipopolysaccharide export system protein LptA
MNLPITFNRAGNKWLVAACSLSLLLSGVALGEGKPTEKTAKPATKTTSKDTKSSAIEVSEKPNKPEKTDKSDKNDNKTYPVNVSADQLISQTQAGNSEYRGNVVLTRNKLETHGDKVRLVHPNNNFETATITGKPATFKDYLPKKQQWMNGEAKQIFFDQDKDTVTLTEDAIMVMDNGNRIKADKIIIYNKTETFEAVGSKQHGGRVQMVIQPE